MAKRARSEAEWGEIAAIGARLRQAREDASLSQTALAERLSEPHRRVVQPDISDWELGKHLPDPRVIARWAEITASDLNDLLLSGPINAGELSSPMEDQLLAVTAA